MYLHSLYYLKIFLSLLLFISGLFMIFTGNKNLNKINNKINNKITTTFNKNVELILPTLNTKKNLLILPKIDKKISTKKINELIIIVKKNDTFSKIISPYFENNLINIIINKIKKKINLNSLKIGQEIYLYKNSQEVINKIIIPISFEKELVINIDKDNIFINSKDIKFTKEIKSIQFSIDSSLYKDGVNNGVPISVLINAIRLYSFDIDFQRDIKKNNQLEISYEKLISSKRNYIKYGNIKYVNLKLNNTNLEYYLFKDSEGITDYYNSEGKNVKKSILKTPIDGARLSSSFGMRKHPISGYNKLHKGVDFAAPRGTPVYAGGNGVIEYASNNGGYGKYIRIKHNNEYKTAYAHLSSFHQRVAKGKRVNQGDIIGYVGSTGNSTGPHLHYEIIFQNKQINPMKLKLPSGRILKGLELKEFKKNIKAIYGEHLFDLYK